MDRTWAADSNGSKGVKVLWTQLSTRTCNGGDQSISRSWSVWGQVTSKMTEGNVMTRMLARAAANGRPTFRRVWRIGMRAQSSAYHLV